jgi:hypothetical protein
MGDSPAVILYDINGNEVTIRDGYDITPVQSGVPIVGTDIDGYARIIQVDSTGNVGVVQATKTKRYDVVSVTLTYLGSAEVGAAESDEVWTIMEFITTPSGDPVSGKIAENVAWDDRATATYL